jgi:PAS domain S-box-containing protein
MSAARRKKAGLDRRAAVPPAARRATGARARSRASEHVSKAKLVSELRGRRVDLSRSVENLQLYWARVQEWDAELSETRAALATAHSRFGEFYDFVPTAFLMLDARFRITQLNAAGAALLGGPGARVVGQPLIAFVAAPDLRSLMAMLHATRPDEPGRIEVRLRAHDGWVPAHVIVRSSGPPGETRSYHAAIVDLSEVRRLEQERARAEEDRRRSLDAERAALASAKAKDDFIAMLSHELRTPLTPILAAADALNAEQVPAALKDAVAIIRRNVVTEARLIDDLLDVARLTTRRLTVETAPVSLHGVIDLVLADWASEATRAGIDVQLELGATSERVEADAARIAQVLRNVLGNALKFSDPGGRIIVSTEDAAGFVRVCVTDTGAGMTPAQIARLFEPFTDSRQQFASRAGLGLGLVISNGIVQAHGGRVRVQSGGTGRGTTVQIELPTTERQAQHAIAPAPASAPAAAPVATAPARAGVARRVLLVEDHEDSALTLSMVLSMRGYAVTVARTMKEAQDLAAGCDLMISDISLPDGSGLELVHHVQQQRPLQAIALSGYGTEEDQKRSRAAGFAEHLTKPVDIDHLLAAVDRLAASPPPTA